MGRLRSALPVVRKQKRESEVIACAGVARVSLQHGREPLRGVGVVACPEGQQAERALGAVRDCRVWAAERYALLALELALPRGATPFARTLGGDGAHVGRARVVFEQ